MKGNAAMKFNGGRPGTGQTWASLLPSDSGDPQTVKLTGIGDGSWLDRAGSHHSYQMHVVERYTMIGPNHIQYEATIEDPEVLTEPFTIAMPLYRRI